MSLDIDVRDVHVEYPDAQALCGVSFHIPFGTICGLLGRNGSGKTTLLSLIASLIKPSAGVVLVDGTDPFEDAELMGQIGLIGDGGKGSPNYSVRDAIGMIAELRTTWDGDYADRLFEQFEIPVKRRITKLSKGQRAAFSVVCGLAARAPITMFDETHIGMDVPSRYRFYDELLRDYLETPRTVILSTHHIDEVASLFGQVIILDRGELVVHEDADTLRDRGAEIIGSAPVVDRFTASMNVLGERSLGATKAAVVYGEFGDDDRQRANALGLELGPIPLQELFVHLSDGRRSLPSAASAASGVHGATGDPATDESEGSA